MSLAHTDTFVPDTVDKEAILRAFNINARDPKAQAMLLACEKYGLDPLLKHAVLISGNLYVTRDGLLHVAHRSDRLDGIVVEDEGETDVEWWARVTVYVKGQTHGYSYRGRYPKSGQQKKYGPEMAVKVAEVMALRRAFGVTGIPTVEEQWDKSDQQVVQRPTPPPLPELSGGGEPSSPPAAAPGVRTGGKGSVVSGSATALDARHAPTPSGASPEPGGETPAPTTTTPLDVDAVEQTADVPAAPAGPEPEAPEWFAGANRKARAIAKSAIGDDSKDPEYVARWEALVWAASGGTTTESKALTKDQHGAFVTRLKDVSSGLARIVETDDPQWLGFTLEYKEVAA